MLTVRHARPELRTPYRWWIRQNAGTIVGVTLGGLILLLLSAGFRSGCEDTADARTCVVLGDAALYLSDDPESASTEWRERPTSTSEDSNSRSTGR